MKKMLAFDLIARETAVYPSWRLVPQPGGAKGITGFPPPLAKSLKKLNLKIQAFKRGLDLT